jgi:hypothetical protein
VPFDASGSYGPGKLILMFVATLIEEMYFVGSGNGNGGVDGNIRDCDSDDSFVIAFKIFYLCF